MGLNLKLCLLAFGIFIASSVLHAQEVVEPKVEVFAGAELHYRDIFYGKIYERDSRFEMEYGQAMETGRTSNYSGL